MSAEKQSPIIPEGPHRRIAVESPGDRFTLDLFDLLWDRYRSRVSYVRDYEEVIAAAGGTFVNDHIAFRTIAGQNPLTGMSSLSRIFEALGYRPAGCYSFEDKHLSAIHFQHPHPEFPKLFISELKSWEFPAQVSGIIESVMATHRGAVSGDILRQLHTVETLNDAQRAVLLQTVLNEFHNLPWDCPQKSAVEAVNQQSQYAAWVLVHGYNVNHFTSLVNSHGVDSLNDIEKTIAALVAAGVPMKADIEGEPGSKLRQSSTEAVMIDIDVMDEQKPTKMPWTYAYFELAERNSIIDPTTGKPVRFEGFLGPQATALFDMTRVRS